jgi:hypothetical protein
MSWAAGFWTAGSSELSLHLLLSAWGASGKFPHQCSGGQSGDGLPEMLSTWTFLEMQTSDWQDKKRNSRGLTSWVLALHPKPSTCSGRWLQPGHSLSHRLHGKSRQAKLRQARIGESLGRLESIWLNMAFPVEHSSLSLSLLFMCRLSTPELKDNCCFLHLAQGSPMLSPLIDYWVGITRFFPSHRLA